MIANVLLVLCALQTARNVEVRIELRDGTQLRGQTSKTWEMKATFGKAEVEPNELSSIDFDESGELATVLCVDGTKLRGKFSFGQLELQVSKDHMLDVSLAKMKRLTVIQLAQPIAGELTKGRSINGLTYHLRAPPSWSREKSFPALIIFHGSNMNAKSYVDTIVAAWPELADDYFLIGINGENRNANSDPASPTFNYSYVNFVGKRSRFKGYPGTDRESPALVRELVEELKVEFNFDRLFVGGHSQGGFLTYSVFMNFPELFDGAFPISSGVIVQAAPDAFIEEAVRAAQRERPLAIVHSSSDKVVQYSMSTGAFDSFREEGFSRVKLFDEPQAGHRFALLPVEQAVRWLEVMSSRDANTLTAAAQDRIAGEQFVEGWALLERAEQYAASDSGAKIDELRQTIEQKAEVIAQQILPLVEANENSGWVDDYLEFAANFKFTQAAKPVSAAYQKLRGAHQPKAEELYAQSKKEFRAGKKDVAYAIYQEVVDKYYASSWYPKMKRWIEER